MLLVYKGKKKRLHLKMPWLTTEYQFRANGQSVEVAKVDAERLLKENSRAFGKIMVQEKPEEVVPEKVELEKVVVKPTIQPSIKTESLDDIPKYPSQMNKEQLVKYAKIKHTTNLDMGKTRAELYDEVSKMDAKLSKGQT